MSSSAEIDLEKPPIHVIETFRAAPGITLEGIAVYLDKMQGQGFELLTAYAAPHPTEAIMVHYYVLRKVKAGQQEMAPRLQQR